MKNLLRPMAMILAFLIMLASFTACSPSDMGDLPPPEEETEKIPPQGAVGKEPGYADDIFALNCNMSAGLNPYYTDSSYNVELIPLMYESLFAVNEDFSYENVLCETFSTEDGKVYRFDVKKGVKFHDGSELTAADVAYSLEPDV